MRKLITVLSLACLYALSGCKAIQQELDKLSDAELASYVQKATDAASYEALRLAAKKYPNDLPMIVSDAKLADQIDTAIIDDFNKTTGDVLSSAVDLALSKFNNKLSSQVSDAIQAAVLAIKVSVNLPKNPTDKLDARTKGAVIAAFTGIKTGTERFLAGQSGTAPGAAPTPPTPVTPPVPAPPTARMAEKNNQVVWPR